jgi:hypothetical protein
LPLKSPTRSDWARVAVAGSGARARACLHTTVRVRACAWAVARGCPSRRATAEKKPSKTHLECDHRAHALRQRLLECVAGCGRAAVARRRKLVPQCDLTGVCARVRRCEEV